MKLINQFCEVRFLSNSSILYCVNFRGSYTLYKTPSFIKWDFNFCTVNSIYFFIIYVIYCCLSVQLEMDNHPISQENEREVVKYQNTYRLHAYNPFKIDPVDKIIETVITTNLENISYNAAECIEVCKLVAVNIKEKIKKLNFDRYKIVVNVTIIEKASQSIYASVGFLWDAEKDNYCTFTYEARKFHAYCCVFGLYYE